MMDHNGLVHSLLGIVTILLPYVISYNLNTVWCNIEDSTRGRCRPADCCYDLRAQSHSNCTAQGAICCPESSKPNQLCEKYGAALFNHFDYITSFGFSFNVNDKALTCANTDTPLIIGGERAREKEFPYMAAIGFGRSRNSVKWHCGGTLISSFFVLSAAHCAKSKPLRSEAKWVLLGALNLSYDYENGRQIFDIVKRTKHPKYKPPSKEYDIILFKLSSPAIFTEYVRPACLNTLDTIDTMNVFATGWGVTSYSDPNHSDTLMKVTLQIRDYEICHAAYQNQSKTDLPNGILDSMLCVGSPAGGKDTCQGDSGGPITIGLKEPKCMYSVVGITSFGMFCGFSTPAIYTRVSYFIPWIIEEISNI